MDKVIKPLFKNSDNFEGWCAPLPLSGISVTLETIYFLEFKNKNFLIKTENIKKKKVFLLKSLLFFTKY